ERDRAALATGCGRSEGVDAAGPVVGRGDGGEFADALEAGDVAGGEGAGLVAVDVEHAPAGAVLLEHWENDLASVARVAGDVAGAEAGDVADDHGAAGGPAAAAGSVHADG